MSDKALTVHFSDGRPSRPITKYERQALNLARLRGIEQEIDMMNKLGFSAVINEDCQALPEAAKRQFREEK